MSIATQAGEAADKETVGFRRIIRKPGPRVVMAAFLPAYLGSGSSQPGDPLWPWTSMAVVIWAAGLVVGGVIARGNVLRWFGVSWIVSLLFPAMPMLLLMAGGALVHNRRDCLRAALLGLLIFPLAGLLPASANGVLLIGCALLLTISMERS